MATTKIWAVGGGRLGKAIPYICNPEKTMYQFFGDDETIQYTSLVDSINCCVPTALLEFMEIKAQYGKADGVQGYHAYQSFAPGEIKEPRIAHEIGMKLAKEMWGNFQVVVATHVDQEHIHNHFVFNSVSCENGKKYNDCYATLKQFQDVNDRFCREYGLSYVANPKYRGKSYAEWMADKEGKGTWRGIIRGDIDAAIRQSGTFRQCIQILEFHGYEVKSKKYLTLRPPGKERFIRLYSLGKGYTEEEIAARILKQTRMEVPKKETVLVARVFRTRSYQGLLYSSRQGGVLFWYRYYLAKLKKFEKSPNRLQTSFRAKEDLARLEQLTGAMNFLAVHSLDTWDEIEAYEKTLKSEKSALTDQRQELRKELRVTESPGEMAALHNRIAQLTTRLTQLRREQQSLDQIKKRSAAEKEKQNQQKESEERTWESNQKPWNK